MDSAVRGIKQCEVAHLTDESLYYTYYPVNVIRFPVYIQKHTVRATVLQTKELS